MIQRAGLRADVQVQANDHLPLNPGGHRAQGRPVSPYDEALHEGMGALHTALADLGVRTVATGIGGDEMVALTREENPHHPLGEGRPFMPWVGPRSREAAEDTERGTAPASVVNEMTLLACACAAPSILRAGMWPIHPLADPALVRFGEWLPQPWRRNKRLHRARLARRGLSREVTHPVLPENFAPLMTESLATYGVQQIDTMLTDGSPLIDAGFLDPDGLAHVRDRIHSGTFDRRDREVFDTIAIHLALLAFTSH